MFVTCEHAPRVECSLRASSPTRQLRRWPCPPPPPHRVNAGAAAQQVLAASHPPKWAAPNTGFQVRTVRLPFPATQAAPTSIGALWWGVRPVVSKCWRSGRPELKTLKRKDEGGSPGQQFSRKKSRLPCDTHTRGHGHGQRPDVHSRAHAARSSSERNRAL